MNTAARPAGRAALRFRTAASPAVPHAVARLAGGQHLHVDERRGGGLADDLADHLADLMVALVQTASTLPVFLLGLPSGALADILDRRRYFLFTQLWVAARRPAAACVVILLGAMSPAAAAGADVRQRHRPGACAGRCLPPSCPSWCRAPPAAARRWPSTACAMNASRIVGPLIAGALIACAGSAWVFLLNALLSMVAAWRASCAGSATHKPQRAARRALSGRHPGRGAVRAASRRRMRTVLLRISLFFMQSAALLALLPLVARKGLHGGGARHATRCCWRPWASGAIAAALFLPRLRQRLARDRLVRAAPLVHAAAMVVREPSRPTSGSPCRRMLRRRHGLDHGGQHAHRLGPAFACPTGCARAACRSTRWR